MDGSTSDLFLIPVMGAIILVSWLVVVFIADPEREVRRALAVGTIARRARLEVTRLAQLETARLAQRADAVLAAPAHRALVIPLPVFGPARELPSAAIPPIIPAGSARDGRERPAA